MNSILSIMGSVAFYWLLLSVACYVVVDFAQRYLYDETTPGIAWRIGLGSFMLAALLAWTQTSFDTMVTSDLPWTILQSLVWFGVFTVVYNFQPQHGAAVGILTMVLVCGVATLAMDSLTRTTSSRPRPEIRTSKPVRAPASPSIAPIAPAPNPAEKAPGK